MRRSLILPSPPFSFPLPVDLDLSTTRHSDSYGTSHATVACSRHDHSCLSSVDLSAPSPTRPSGSEMHVRMSFAALDATQNDTVLRMRRLLRFRRHYSRSFSSPACFSTPSSKVYVWTTSSVLDTSATRHSNAYGTPHAKATHALAAATLVYFLR